MALNEDIERFRTAADDYCRWTEASPSASERIEAETAARLLAALLHFIQPLRGQTGEEVSDYEPPPVTDETRQRVLNRFAALPFSYYTLSLKPYKCDLDEAMACTILSDDLADIYYDLRKGLDYLQAGLPGDALFHWQLMHDSHWGLHATSALYALRCWLSDM